MLNDLSFLRYWWHRPCLEWRGFCSRERSSCCCSCLWRWSTSRGPSRHSVQENISISEDKRRCLSLTDDKTISQDPALLKAPPPLSQAFSSCLLSSAWVWWTRRENKEPEHAFTPLYPFLSHLPLALSSPISLSTPTSPFLSRAFHPYWCSDFISN